MSESEIFPIIVDPIVSNGGIAYASGKRSQKD